jgi:formylglycine-generating enzyme required for sulfatase activity
MDEIQDTDQNKDGRQVNTQGGTYVEGNVNINPSATGEADLKAYLRSLAVECSRLPLGIIDEQFANKNPLSLKDVYIDLDVLGVQLDRTKELHLLKRELEQPLDRTKELHLLKRELEQPQGGNRVPLIAAIAGEKARRIVLLGVAGSGKTTFIHYLTYLLARAYTEDQPDDLPKALRGLVPVRLVLRKVAAHVPLGAACGKAEMLWNALEEDLKSKLGKDGAALGLIWLKKEMQAGRSLVLLDGLDEVPEAGQRRACLLQAVAEFLSVLPADQRVILTARPYAYADPAWRLDGCEVFNLAPLNLKQVERFVKRWYASVRASINQDEDGAARRSEQLVTAIKERSYLADLASRPLLLTQMAMLHSTRKELPEDRADLYEKTVNLLLVLWQNGGIGAKIKLGEQTVELDPEFVRQALAELAYQTQQRQRSERVSEGPGDIPFGDLLVCFGKRLKRIQYNLNPLDLATYLENRTGLLVEREPERYCFAHRSFQEYLAACHLLDASEDRSADLRGLVAEDAAWWREVILLAVGKTQQGGMGAALDLLRSALLPVAVEECPAPDVVDWRAAALGGQALLELRVKERQAEQAESPRNLPRARKWLVGVLERSGLPARERVEVGDALARLGDPRFDPECCYLPREELLGFVRISEGSFQMGSDPKRDSRAMEMEQPQHAVELSEFYIQRYPVTVAQFGAFVGQSGYRPNNPRCLNGIANHPVVYVTWDDAVAYCQWLDGWLREKGPDGLRRCLAEGWKIRLPTEAEWEKAVRGVDGRIYPWGDKFDAERANTDESRIGGTSPVGSFPRGASPYGVLDMSGNAWEWCADWYDEKYYRKSLALNPRVPKAGNYRVLRGGSFNDSSAGARCAYRRGGDPYIGFSNFGFRAGYSPFFSR